MLLFIWCWNILDVSWCCVYLLFYFALPTQTDSRKGENFDKIFTRVPIRLTPTDSAVLMNTKGDEFEGFTFVNSQFGFYI